MASARHVSHQELREVVPFWNNIDLNPIGLRWKYGHPFLKYLFIVNKFTALCIVLL